RMGPGAGRRGPPALLPVRQQCRAHGNRLGHAPPVRARHWLQGPFDPPVEPRGHLRRACAPASRGEGADVMNWHGINAIYKFEMARWGRTLWQSLITPVITTALYFVVFG